MEAAASKQTKEPQNRLPPRRGQIKIRMIKNFIKAVTAVSSKAKRKENGSGLSSSSTTAAPTPSGYTSDAPSES